MSQQTLKRVFTVILVAILATSFSTFVLASGIGLEAEISPKYTDAQTPIQNIAGQLLTVVQVVGVAVAVIMLVWLGIKYIAAAPEAKADIKKGAVMYIVGAILLFGASGLIQIFKNMGESLNDVL